MILGKVAQSSKSVRLADLVPRKVSFPLPSNDHTKLLGHFMDLVETRSSDRAALHQPAM